MSDLRDAPDIRQALPLLARHEGVWDGWYRYVDLAGQQTDVHRSRLVCRFPAPGEDSGVDYDQTNHYSWADGRTEIRPFPAVLRGDRIVFQSDLIDGWAADVRLDTQQRTTMLNWTRRGEPGVYLYEMIQLSDCGNFRSRTWHWFREGRLYQRTLIDEQRVSSSTAWVTGPTFAGDPVG